MIFSSPKQYLALEPALDNELTQLLTHIGSLSSNGLVSH